MLKLTYRSSSRGSLERKLRYRMDAIVQIWPDLQDFERLFKIEVSKMPRMNHIVAEHAFRLRPLGESALAVWHYTPDGDPDRMIAEIKYEPETQNF